MLKNRAWIFDPCAGDGTRLKELRDNYLPDSFFLGTEIEKEWAEITPSIIMNMDAFDYLRLTVTRYDAILTSPVFGNRMSDNFNARDASKRITYRHRLGHELSENNSGKLQWGDTYRNFHERLWEECIRVLKPDGIFVLNIKDHIRKGKRILVTDWHIDTLCCLGMFVTEHVKMEVPSMKRGENYDLRIPYESIIAFQKL